MGTIHIGVLLTKRLVYIWLMLLIMLVYPVTSYGDEPPNRVSPNPDVGVADINMGLEAAHVSLTADHIGYKFLDANYQQAQNAGASWNRWKIDWSCSQWFSQSVLVDPQNSDSASLTTG